MKPKLLTFDEAYFERIWGGRKLETHFGKPIPPQKPVGEAWLLSDHEQHVSALRNGAATRTLHDLVKDDPGGLLGSPGKPTVHGQFPLLLKILDAADYLSVQVHPNDEDAARLGEPDVGKTEMWYVLEAEPGAELICGMPPEVTREQFKTALEEKRLGEILTRFPVEQGTAVFVPAGTVHAIGPGVVLAEIQQNSNITYRVYDWDRVQADGKPRELHIEKSLEVTRFGSRHAGPNRPLAYPMPGASVTVLAACRYFAAQRLDIKNEYSAKCAGFRILFGVSGEFEVSANSNARLLHRGEALVVPAGAGGYTLRGDGACLEYFVPDLRADIVQPLRERGQHDPAHIVALGGDPATSDLRALV